MGGVRRDRKTHRCVAALARSEHPGAIRDQQLRHGHDRVEVQLRIRSILGVVQSAGRAGGLIRSRGWSTYPHAVGVPIRSVVTSEASRVLLNPNST